MITLQLKQPSSFFRTIIVAGVVAVTGCMPKQAAVVAPVPDALGAASVLQDQTRLEDPIRILFVWELNDAGVGVKGRGVARVAPPYRARLDLFLDNGELVIRAALVDGELRLPAGAPNDILPFDNETNRFELSGELYDQLVRNLPSALGIRTAGEEVADAVVRGSIRTYEVRAPNYRAAIQGQPAEVLQRQVNIVVSVEIVDLVENVILWESSSVVAQGEFLEASETEEIGRIQAIELLVQKIVDGAQSNW